MKKIIFILISLIALLSVAEAQVHNAEAGAGMNGTQVLGHTTSGTTTLNTSGDWGKFAVSVKGGAFVTLSDPSSGLSQSVIPVSNSVGLNGVAVGNVGWVRMGTDAVEAASTTTVLNLTAHTLRVGDAVQLVSGTAGNVQAWAIVSATTTNTVTLATPLPATPAAADVLNILRPTPITASSAVSATASAMATFLDQNYQPTTASGIMKAENAVANDGDSGVAVWSVRNEGYQDFGNANLDYNPFATYRSGALMVNLDYSALGASDIGVPYALEDGAIANGKALMMAGGVNNRSGTAYNTTNGDATPFGVGDFGNSFSTLYFDATIFDGGVSPIGKEDRALNGSDALVMTGVRWLGTGAFGSPAGTANDAVYPDTDSENRLAVNAWGAQPGNFWQSCGTATASTADVAIIAADVSNRTYVGTITCKNTAAATATSIDFKDGTTIIAVGGVNQMAAGSAGTFTVTFNPPLRGTSNTAFNFATNVSTSSVTCCGSGFKSDQ